MDRNVFGIFAGTPILSMCVIVTVINKKMNAGRKVVQIEYKKDDDRIYTQYRCLFFAIALNILLRMMHKTLLVYFGRAGLFQQDRAYIMIGNIRLVFGISHLSYSSRTIPLLNKYQLPTPHFPLLNLTNTTTAPSLFSRLLNPTPHGELLQLYLNFAEKGEEKPQGIAYQWIEENLRKAVLRKLQAQKLKVSIAKFKALSSEQIEEKQFRGVFIHRNLNMSSQAYDIKPHSNGSITFELKKALRSDVLQEYERIVRVYSKDRMDDIYCKGYDDFQKNFAIKRTIYRLTADIQLNIDRNGVKETLGGSPTEHLLQVESVFNQYYSMQEHFLTDVDFFLGGNYFLPGNYS